MLPRSSDQLTFFNEKLLTSSYNDSLSDVLNFRSTNQLTLFLKYTGNVGEYADVMVEYFANGFWYEYGRWIDSAGNPNLEYQLKPFKVIHGVNSYIAINETTAEKIRVKAKSSTAGTLSVYGSYFIS